MKPLPLRDTLTHMLRVFGIVTLPRELNIASGGGNDLADTDLSIIISPSEDYCRKFGISMNSLPITKLNFEIPKRKLTGQLGSLRSLHTYSVFEIGGSDHNVEPILLDGLGNIVWLCIRQDSRVILVIGTEVVEDIIRFRQGDPLQATERNNSSAWSFDFERPNYLFESQLGADLGTTIPEPRFADEWCDLLAESVSQNFQVERSPMLPNGARAALVITGDDDQAYLEKYLEQQKALDKLPITYLMHPETRHDRQSSKEMFAGKNVELGLHPDALETPKEYGTRLTEQTSWFKEHFGFSPISVRNHGFLNDGYWGHTEHWVSHGLEFSSNLPGLDGHMLNGSLLPARLVLDGELTSHWSILTTFGDGMVFALDLTDHDAADKLRQFAKGLIDSSIPGVIVINLHPQNIDETRELHAALHDIVEMGCIPWTMRECLGWFNERDTSAYERNENVVKTWWRNLIGRIT
jgi:hypothetical protein